MLKKIVEYLPSTVIPIVISFFLVFIYARQMSPSEYGVYNLYLNSISIIYAVTMSFLQSASFRFYTIEGMYSDLKEFYSTYYASNFIIGCLLAAVLLGANLILGFDWQVIIFAVVINAFYQFQLNVYRLADSTLGYTFARLSASFGALILILGIVALSCPISYDVPIYTFYGAYLPTVIVGVVKNAKYLSLRKISKKIILKSLRFGVPMMGVSVMGLLISYSAQYAILHYLSETAVGFYSLGFRLSDTVVSNITMIILVVMTPAVMRAYDEGGAEGAQIGSSLLKKLINLNFWVILPCCTVLIIYCESIIRLLFPSYEGAELIIIVLVFSSIFRSLSMITCKGLELSKKTGKILLYLSVSLGINILYILIFLPIYGIEAAGHASLLAYFIYNILLIKESQKFVPIKFDLHFILKTIFACGILVATALLMIYIFDVPSMLMLMVQILVCIAIYLALSFKFNLYKF